MTVLRFLPALFFLICLTLASPAGAEGEPFKPSDKDKCPVCGMFVAKYPDFLAQVVFADGSRIWFDGVKDMMKYYLDLPRYQPDKKLPDIKEVVVADYYSLKPVDGFKAFFVQGSDVYGPMGRELIPFAEEAAAREFMADHKGKSILTFSQITPETVKELD